MKKKNVTACILAVAALSIVCVAASIANGSRDKKIKEFTAFFDVQGEEIDEDNEIRELIAQKTGARCIEQWLSGKSAEDAVASFIASGEYTDFISGSTILYEARALVPIDAYWDNYPNIKNFLPAELWDRFRQPDGHIYWIPQFGVVHGKSAEVLHEGEAFWIQTRVLKWAGYPQIRTVDEYFDLIEAYVAANPMMGDEKNIPFTILCDDWRDFCLENPPQFLDGYPNDGSCMVDAETQTVLDYNTTETARRYFQKLNEEYKKGIIDQEFLHRTIKNILRSLQAAGCLAWWISGGSSRMRSTIHSNGWLIMAVVMCRCRSQLTGVSQTSGM